ncbi:class I SAM-dependent methyltransferase [Streptomyces sp. TR06-5]|uniref:class I SAM-dependent methyltransferase n=1 Tax=unclassified Streptomyces TaxID=2593676 RepID=UPI0039A259B2
MTEDIDSTLRSRLHQGTGPGTFTPDGCSVSLYTRLPGDGTADVVAGTAPPGATVLELGAGAGRTTRPLLEKGFRVTAVDESAEMLAHIGGTPTVRSTIEDLRLDTRFDVVLLASFLVNTADPALRDALLATCARHVAPGGAVLVQREGAWHRSKEAGDTWHRDGMTVRVTLREYTPEGVKRTRMEYAFEDATWSHTFLSHDLPDGPFEEALARAGLALDRHLDDGRTWARAVPAGQ